MRPATSRYILLLIATAGLTCASAGRSDDNVCVPDVMGQFEALKHHPEALAFYRTYSTPTDCSGAHWDHYQGIVRPTGAGPAYLYVSRDEPPEILIVEMGSRDKDGERLRTSRLLHGVKTASTPPDDADREIALAIPDVLEEMAADGLKHPGGMQALGDVLIVPMEGSAPGRILLLDISNRTSPELLHEIQLTHAAAATAIARLPDDGRYLLLVEVSSTGSNHDRIEAFLSNATDLRDPNLQFTHFDGVHVGPGWGGYEHISLLKQCDGRLFVAGTRNTGCWGLPHCGDDVVSLWELFVDLDNPWIGFVPRILNKKMHCDFDGTGRVCNFQAAAGFYVSPTGELIMYAAEHCSDGPGPGGVSVAEYRHRDVVRPGSPTYDPTVEAGGPYVVATGQTVVLAGSADSPVMTAWAELYAHKDFKGRSIMFELTDRYKDDFLNFSLLDGFNNKAHSVRWWAPPGCSIELLTYKCSDGRFPGPVFVLTGTGQVETIENLGSYGWGDRASGIRFSFDANDPHVCLLPPRSHAACEQEELTYAWEVLEADPPGIIAGPADQPEAVFAGLQPGTATVALTVCTAAGRCAQDTALITVLGSCPWDLDGDGVVTSRDLITLLSAWGANAEHPADLNLDGRVDVADLGALLGNWGPCF